MDILILGKHDTQTIQTKFIENLFSETFETRKITT